MKKIIGLVLLIVLLVAVTGCTQTKTANATAAATTAAPTAAPTTEVTTIETTAPATEVTTEAAPTATTEIATAVTPEANATAAPTTAMATVVPTLTFSKVTTVHFTNGTFVPATIMALPGTGIIWQNDDTVVHSVKTTGDHAGMFNSGDILPGGRWSYTFSEKEGTYQYADGYNPNATGTVIIKSGEVLYGVAAPTTYVTSNATW